MTDFPSGTSASGRATRNASAASASRPDPIRRLRECVAGTAARSCASAAGERSVEICGNLRQAGDETGPFPRLQAQRQIADMEMRVAVVQAALALDLQVEIPIPRARWDDFPAVVAWIVSVTVPGTATVSLPPSAAISGWNPSGQVSP